LPFSFPVRVRKPLAWEKNSPTNTGGASNFEEADDALGYKLSALCFEGPEEKLKLTEITQPAILTASVAAWRVLQERGLQPDFVAGTVWASIRPMWPRHVDVCRCGADGAQARQVYAGSRARRRGRDGGNSGMPLDQVSAIAAEAAGDAANGAAQREVCQAANINSPEQIVISGHAGAVERAIQLATERGAKKAVSCR